LVIPFSAKALSELLIMHDLNPLLKEEPVYGVVVDTGVIEVPSLHDLQTMDNLKKWAPKCCVERNN
jgi:hypothetical protein